MPLKTESRCEVPPRPGLEVFLYFDDVVQLGLRDGKWRNGMFLLMDFPASCFLTETFEKGSFFQSSFAGGCFSNMSRFPLLESLVPGGPVRAW